MFSAHCYHFVFHQRMIIVLKTYASFKPKYGNPDALLPSTERYLFIVNIYVLEQKPNLSSQANMWFLNQIT